MNPVTKLKTSLSIPSNLYLMGLSITGLIIYILNTRWTLLISLTTSEWVLLYSLAGSVLLLNHVLFRLPPEGNALSMDSALYLACIFSFGLEISLYALFFSAVIYALYARTVAWWKHFVNFSSYSLMITGAYYTFIQTGGQVGLMDTNAIYPYLLAMTVYFVVNMVSFGLYFMILTKGNLLRVIQGIVKETIMAYLSTLLLSLMLTMMFQVQFYVGLFLFLIIAVLLSVSFKKLFELYQEVADKATRDQRTGLYNHSYFEELLEKELVKAKASGTPLSLVLLDVDSFKKYNDTFGHLKGDKLLDHFGSLLLSECKPHQYIVARHGGDEFTILLPGKLEKETFSFLNTLRKKVNDSYFEGVEIFPHGCLSFSAGIIEYNGGIFDKSVLLDKADQAMYYAKAQGKNHVHIYHDQNLNQKTIDMEKDIVEIEQQLKIFLSKDVYTFQHSKRVFNYAIDICDYIPLNDSEQRTLILGALFHDIGKLEVPKQILQKKEKLTPEEWDIVKKHVEWGKEIASASDKYMDLLPLIELHHERIDGKGYPYGLKEDEIPKLTRILSVIDSFDAMTTERPYQKTKTFDEAIHELRRCAGQQFDPEFVETFIQMISTKYDFKLLNGV